SMSNRRESGLFNLTKRTKWSEGIFGLSNAENTLNGGSAFRAKSRRVFCFAANHLSTLESIIKSTRQFLPRNSSTESPYELDRRFQGNTKASRPPGLRKA